MEKWAVVTGASSGLGVEFAKILAGKLFNIVLVARREAPMLALANEIEDTFKIRCKVIALNLAEPGAASNLQSHLDLEGIEPEILINNAGIGFSGFFKDQSLESLNAMLMLNITALTELTYLFAKKMSLNQRGHILLVSSMAANQPVPKLAAYSASKAYVHSLGMALHEEFAPHVNITVLQPGVLNTEFAQRSGFKVPDAAKISIIPVKDAASIGINAMFAKKSCVVAGAMNQVMAAMTPLIPPDIAAKIALTMSN